MLFQGNISTLHPINKHPPRNADTPRPLNLPPSWFFLPITTISLVCICQKWTKEVVSPCPFYSLSTQVWVHLLLPLAKKKKWWCLLQLSHILPICTCFFVCLIFCRNCFSVLLLPIILFPLRWLYLFSQKQCFGWGSSPHRCCPHCIMDFPITLSTMSETKHVDVHDAVGQYSKHRSPFRALCQHIPRKLFHRTRRIVTCNCFDLVKKSARWCNLTSKNEIVPHKKCILTPE